MNSDVSKIIKTYLKHFENEKEQLNQLITLVGESNGKDIFSSTNIKGHITASGFIYAKKEKAILLLEHKKLEKSLQPGGHVEDEDTTILDSAIREIHEETGLENLELINLFDNKDIPFDINTHIIPDSPKKNMPQHYHHDFRYLFIVDKTSDIRIDLNESNNYKWIKISDLQQIEDFKVVIQKINKMLEI